MLHISSFRDSKEVNNTGTEEIHKNDIAAKQISLATN